MTERYEVRCEGGIVVMYGDKPIAVGVTRVEALGNYERAALASNGALPMIKWVSGVI